jgi:hypothetical protein
MLDNLVRMRDILSMHVQELDHVRWAAASQRDALPPILHTLRGARFRVLQNQPRVHRLMIFCAIPALFLAA